MIKKPEEIKKGLECCSVEYKCPTDCRPCPYVARKPFCESEMHRDALALIQQLEAQIPKWISVEERLPEEFVDVLVFRDGCYAIACITNNEPVDGLVWSFTGIGGNPTHWMPLPEPPKEDAHGAEF